MGTSGRRGDADGGQLLLLAGIVLVLAFVVTAFTLAQVADVEKQAAQEQQQDFLTEYRFLRMKVGSIVEGNTGRTSDNLSFNATFNATVTSFRNSLMTKGYDASILLGASDLGVEKPECAWLATSCPSGAGPHDWGGVVPVGGTRAFTHHYDGTSDGLVWLCGQGGGLVGAVIDIYLSDGRNSIAETFVVAVNQDWYDEEMDPGPPCS